MLNRQRQIERQLNSRRSDLSRNSQLMWQGSLERGINSKAVNENETEQESKKQSSQDKIIDACAYSELSAGFIFYTSLVKIQSIQAHESKDKGDDDTETRKCINPNILHFTLAQSKVKRRSICYTINSKLLSIGISVNSEIFMRDGIFEFDVIVLLWPCYGFIAMTFIFFMGSLLLFVGSLCSQHSQNSDEYDYHQKYQNQVLRDNGIKVQEGQSRLPEKDQTFSCSVAFWIMSNCGYFLTFSIMGFFILLKQQKEQEIMTKSYYTLIIFPICIASYIAIQYQQICRWYYVKIIRPSIVSELRQQQLEFERNREQQRGSGFEERQQDDENPEIAQQQVHDADITELNKIQLIDENPEHKEKVLRAVPLFLIKISRSYFQKVEQYSQQFLDKVTSQISHAQKKKQKKQNDLLSMDFAIPTERKNFKGFKKQQFLQKKKLDDHYITSKQRLAKYLQEKGNIQQPDASKSPISLDKLSCKYEEKNIDSQLDELLDDYSVSLEQKDEYKTKVETFDFTKTTQNKISQEVKQDSLKNQDEVLKDELDRFCLTSQLQVDSKSLECSISSQNQSECSVQNSNKKTKQAARKRRRNSFDFQIIKKVQLEIPDYVNPQILRQKIIKTIQKLNKEMGFQHSESEVNTKRQSIIPKEELKKGLQNIEEANLQSLNENKLCMLCLERKSDAVVMDCGHANICFFCAFKLY
ncbi:UNKNOWN [Stylonychia lemnae]|uniref:RING-type domain-containing protein n=1 Tax=Stylonychia lemnae TaxID=5949 RepID=A0A077ZVM1_STYLE|nr:UNKNOWN [Stylonychia lemnae]|eukprot:CDW73671.1 UNKNOWN [Stylonychia lemnae]